MQNKSLVLSDAQRVIPQHASKHLAAIRDFYESAPEPNWAGRRYRDLLARYYGLLIPPAASVLEVGCGSGYLLSRLPNRNVAGVDISPRQIDLARHNVPWGRFFVQSAETLTLDESFDFIILSDTVNFAADVQQIFERLTTVAHRDTRLVLNFNSNLWRPVFAILMLFGLKARQPESNWLTPQDVRNLMLLGGWEVVKCEPRMLFPLWIRGLHSVVNRLIGPLLPWFCVTWMCVGRCRSVIQRREYSISIVIPARNESGNIESAVKRLPELGQHTEIIFVEGHSRDGTWEEIQRVALTYTLRDIKALRQTGRGKGNAIREGFAAASGEILMILDADLTMPPEELMKFYAVLASGTADFANGVRLVYPQERQAMQFLNLCANKMFGILFSWLLGQSVKDTLCGTKVLFRRDYQRIAQNRAYFGDFDPFGDFDLLFGADKLNLKIVDVPIRYQQRQYGRTNIHRWRHGWLLLRMVVFAARKLKFV